MSVRGSNRPAPRSLTRRFDGRSAPWEHEPEFLALRIWRARRLQPGVPSTAPSASEHFPRPLEGLFASRGPASSRTSGCVSGTPAAGRARQPASCFRAECSIHRGMVRAPSALHGRAAAASGTGQARRPTVGGLARAGGSVVALSAWVQRGLGRWRCGGSGRSRFAHRRRWVGRHGGRTGRGLLAWLPAGNTEVQRPGPLRGRELVPA
jgi:hypothetical protein